MHDGTRYGMLSANGFRFNWRPGLDHSPTSVLKACLLLVNTMEVLLLLSQIPMRIALKLSP